MNEINWHTGNPKKSGIYLTTRLSKFKDSKPYTKLNMWKGKDYPGYNGEPMWEMLVSDNSETIAWADIKNDIKPFK